jgi:alpha-tubulin suppressor-like RCC1 family protein
MKHYLYRLFCFYLLFAGLCATAQINRTAGKSSIAFRNNYQRVSAGLSHTLEIRNGQLWAWGNNQYGQLGDSSKIGRISPVRIGTDEDWVTVSAGRDHSMAIKANGSLWGWGRNAFGEVGNGTTQQILFPTQIGTEQNWISVSSTHGNHTIALKADGSLWAWGYNLNGQLGDSSTTNRTSPKQIGQDRLWINISTGYQHSLGIKSDGSLWAWGLNSSGQLGDHGTVRRIKPVQIDSVSSVSNGWVSVSCGFTHTLALKANGTLWAWGANGLGQLGDSSNINSLSPIMVSNNSDFVSISAGGNHNMALKANGTLWVWGSGNRGQMGNGSTNNLWVPTKMQVDPALPGWTMISAGYDHGMGVKADGSLMAWGRNDIGQIGDSSYVQQEIPVFISVVLNWVSFSAGANYTIALKSNGTLWAWGDNTYGQLGDGTNSQQNKPVPLGTDHDWISISCGEYHNLALKCDGTLWAWGKSDFGQIGDAFTLNRNKPVRIGADSNWTNIAAGGSHSLALKADGTIWAWGYNGFGQLGINSRKNWSRPVKMQSDSFWVSIVCGDNHSHGITSNGRLWSWGNNNIGQLGVAKLEDYVTYPRMLDIGYHTVAFSSKGNDGKFRNSKGEIRRIDSSTKIVDKDGWMAVVNGIDYTLAIDASGMLHAQGKNNFGQMGDGTIIEKVILTLIGNQSPIVFVNAGFYHSGIIKSDRKSLCMTGFNNRGQLGKNDTVAISVYTCGIPSGLEVATLALEKQIKCAGDKINVPFKASGVFDTSNVFTAELSNSIGQFVNPVVIGTIKSNRSDTILAITPLNTTTDYRYRIRVVSSIPPAIGTNNGKDLTIYSMKKPVISTKDTTTFCFGGQVKFNVVVSPAASLVWYRNYQEISGTSGISYLTKMSGVYHLIAELGGVCKDSSNKISVLVNPLPIIVSNPVNELIKSGQRATFNISVTDKTAKRQWQQDAGLDFVNLKNSNIFSGVDSDTLTIDSVNFEMNNFHYRCWVSSAEGCSSISNPAILTVEELVGIREFTLANGFSVFPNPASHRFTLKANTLVFGWSYCLKDLIGKTILTGLINNPLTTVNIENISKGMYFLSVNGFEGSAIKIIKN